MSRSGVVNRITVFLLVLGCLPFVSSRWGFESHKVTSQIAQEFLSSAAAKQVANITNGQQLQDISTWADEIRGFIFSHFVPLLLSISLNSIFLTN